MYFRFIPQTFSTSFSLLIVVSSKLFIEVFIFTYIIYIMTMDPTHIACGNLSNLTQLVVLSNWGVGFWFVPKLSCDG